MLDVRLHVLARTGTCVVHDIPVGKMVESSLYLSYDRFSDTLV